VLTALDEVAAPVPDDAAALADAVAADAVAADALPEVDAGLDEELLLLQPATAASPAAAATQAMRQRVPDLRLLGAGVFIPPPSRGLVTVPPDGIVSVLRNLLVCPSCAQVTVT
jgi:hypothetical protein